MSKKRLLIIGTAPQYLIKEYVATINQAHADVHLLLPERDRDAFDDFNLTYFKGCFHPFIMPLLLTMISFRPEEVVIVCGMTYDHDNVVNSIKFYSNFINFDLKLSVRNEDTGIDTGIRPSALKEITKWLGLGAIALTIKAISPFKTIRCGEIFSDRLGHLAMESEIYLSEAELGLHDGYYDVFCFKNNDVANKTLAELFSRKMRINTRFNYILDSIRKFNMRSRHEVALVTRKLTHCRDAQCTLQQTEKHLEFSAEKFRSCFRKSKYNSRFSTPISAHFLRKHKDILF